VPLWWDAGTLTDLAEWQAERVRHGARSSDPFVCSGLAYRFGRPIQRAAIRRRFISACKVLGLARLRTLTIHHGRHTFISHALAGGRTLGEVRAAGGHSNVGITSGYLHVVGDEESNQPESPESRQDSLEFPGTTVLSVLTGFRTRDSESGGA